MSSFTIVGTPFTPEQFQNYVTGIDISAWTPNKIVLHNTAVPTLAQRPHGFSAANMVDLQHYYEGLGWSGGPHLFVDQNVIWAFNPLNRRGVHSPSWNKDSWGVEMLGDYAAEAFDSGPGLAVQKNAMSALATMFKKLGVATVTDTNFKLHKEDPGTTHVCPGAHVHKPAVKAAVQAILDAPVVPTDITAKVIVYRAGQGHDPSAVLAAIVRGGKLMADATALRAATGVQTAGTGMVGVRDFVQDAYSISWDAANHKAYLVEQ